jgi:hypothetical protein
VIKVESKSKAAILRLPFEADCTVVAAPNRPTSKLSLTIRHTIFSGSFCEGGLKKFVTALPVLSQYVVSAGVLLDDRLVVVDCIRRFDVGGDTFLPLELGRLPKPGRVDILDSFIARGVACRL